MYTSLSSLSNSLVAQNISNLLKLINVEPLITSLIDTEHWSAMQAKQACQRYLNFLYLTWLYPDRPLVPTQEIDRVWHTHILHTRQYRQDCQTLFGCYLDHEPCLDPEQRFNPLHLSLFEQTKILFERHFGAGSFEDCQDDPAACGRPRI